MVVVLICGSYITYAQVITDTSRQASTQEALSNTAPTSDSLAKAASPDYGDITIYWKDFTKFALTKDYSSLAVLTQFPFWSRMASIEKTEFITNFSFSDNDLEVIRNTTTPMPYEINGNVCFKVDLAISVLYFERINGAYKFTTIIFGE